VINVEESQLHIDPGPGALTAARLYDVSLRATTALLISKNSLYNCGDINAVIDAMTYAGFDKQSVLIADNEVINGPSFLQQQYRDYLERFIVLESGRKVAVNEVEIQSIDLKEGIGFKIFAPEFTLAYLPETSPSLAEHCKNVNILVLSLADPQAREETIKLIQKVNPRLAIITNFGLKMIQADPLYEAREIQKASQVQTVAAKDGLVINPISYSAEQGQKTLPRYSKADQQQDTIA